MQLNITSALNETELENFLTYIGVILKKEDQKFFLDQVRQCLSEKNTLMIFQDLINYAIKFSIEVSEF